jgi:hypothetical protein
VHLSISTSSVVATEESGGVLRTVGSMLCGVAAAIVALELLFRVLPVSTSTATGYYFDPLILTYPAGHRFTMATGWELQNAHHHRANNFGFLAEHDFVRDPTAVALIGDSFVEENMLPADERLAPQLESRLDGRKVYSLGAPGSALLDYAERMRFASERFGVKDFVLVLEPGDVAQSICGSGNIHARCLDAKTLQPRIEKQPVPGTLKKLMRESAFAQYLFSQLKLDPAGWVKKMRSSLAAADAPAAPQQDRRNASDQVATRVVDEFFALVRPLPVSSLTFVLLGDAQPSKEADPARQRLLDAAQANAARVVDAGPFLREYGQRTGLSIYVSPHDHHLNRLALGLIAEKLAPTLPAMTSSASSP